MPQVRGTSRPSLCRRLVGLCFSLVFVLTCIGPRIAVSGELPPVRVTHHVHQLSCTIAALPKNASVTLELRYETHDRIQPRKSPQSIGFETSAVKLRQSLERPEKPFVYLRPYRTGSWRIIQTTFAPDTFFGERMRDACSRGCALKEARSIDMWSRVFVGAPAAGAPVGLCLDLSDLEQEYQNANRVVLTFVGFGDAESFGFHVDEYTPHGVQHTRAICH